MMEPPLLLHRCNAPTVMIFESPILSSYKRKCKHAEQTVKSLDSVLNINSLWATNTKKGNL